MYWTCNGRTKLEVLHEITKQRRAGRSPEGGGKEVLLLGPSKTSVGVSADKEWCVILFDSGQNVLGTLPPKCSFRKAVATMRSISHEDPDIEEVMLDPNQQSPMITMGYGEVLSGQTNILTTRQGNRLPEVAPEFNSSLIVFTARGQTQNSMLKG